MSIDIYAVLDKFMKSLDIDQSGVAALESVTAYLREAEKSGYFGTLYRTDFVVEGKGFFPVDMLRYTSSWPKNETDARAIEDALSTNTEIRRTVTLSMKHRDPEPRLAADRWEAKFRWRVVHVVETVEI